MVRCFFYAHFVEKGNIFTEKLAVPPIVIFGIIISVSVANPIKTLLSGG